MLYGGCIVDGGKLDAVVILTEGDHVFSQGHNSMLKASANAVSPLAINQSFLVYFGYRSISQGPPHIVICSC